VLSDEDLPEDHSARPDGLPFVLRSPLAAGSATESGNLKSLLLGAERGVVIAGRHERDTALPEAVARFAETLGWPLLADPLSGARRGPAAIAHYDALLRDADLASSLRPDFVLRVGDLPVSKPLRSWLGGLEDVTQVALDLEEAWQDPESMLSHSFALEPTGALSELSEALSSPGTEGVEGDWLGSWRRVDELATEAIVEALSEGGLSEPLLAGELGVLLPEETTLFVASSMPVRDIETFWPARDDPPRVLCNRGANGIDGTVSSAFGAAAAGEGPVVLLIGDVALAHDIGGLLAAGRLQLKLTIVLIDNSGGGIFDFLPISQSPMALAPDLQTEGSIFACHVSTATGLDFSKAADLYGLDHEEVKEVKAFRAALERSLSGERSSIIEVRTQRPENVELHRHIWKSVSEKLTS
jgi:2-succinyl-5-enolpyruvyl-6-hydroxy-3-cyclohexene-1-carboxylate synthase